MQNDKTVKISKASYKAVKEVAVRDGKIIKRIIEAAIEAYLGKERVA